MQKTDGTTAQVGAWLSPPLLQDLVLTVLADNMRERLDTVWSGGMVRLLEQFGFAPGASRVALSRLQRRDLIAPERAGRLVSYRLTPRFERVLRESDRRIFALDSYRFTGDEVTLLIHALPDERRVELSRLGRQLRFLGFGTVQDGVWIGAGDRGAEVEPILERLDIRSYASVVAGSLIGGAFPEAVLERVWDLPRLAERYDEFVTTFAGWGQPASDRDAFVLRTQAMHSFRQFPMLDPGLDGPQHPAPAAKAEAVDVFRRMYAGYESAAHRFFDAVVA